MLKGINPSVYEFSDHHHHHHHNHGLECSATAEVDDEIFGSDEFRMYAYKVKRCPRTRSHDWTECPYAHRGEKAQRRDPRRHAYAAVVCPSFRTTATCERGESCEFAHGVFEYWLHPSRYRTRACNSGRLCQRKVCFFAHSPDQLRRGDPSSVKLKRGHHHYAYRARAAAAANANTDAAATSTSSPSSSSKTTGSSSAVGGNTIVDDDSFEKFSEFLKSLRALKIGDDGDHDREYDAEIRPVMMMMMMSSGLDVSTESDLDLTHNVEWISELVK